MKRRKWHVLLTSALIASMTMQTFAAAWQQNSDSTWSWVNDDGSKLTNSWKQDPDGNWYHLDVNGIMQTGWIIDESGNRYFLNPNVNDPQGSMAVGWKLINNVWYFFNTVHDGTYGKSLTGWQWIDGYCYYFDQDGKMLANTMTPDGYTVNEDGRWAQNGVVVYEVGKGISTIQTPLSSPGTIHSSGGTSSGGSGGSGGGSGGGGSSGGSSSSSRTYSYTVFCIDVDTGEVIESYELSGKRGTTLTFDYSFDGYNYYSGDTVVELSSDNAEFTLYYKQKTEDPNTPETPEETEYTYTIHYVDMETGNILNSITDSGNEGSVIEIEKLTFDGYKLAANNSYEFTLSSDGMVKFVYYEPVRAEDEKETYEYIIQYVCEDEILGEFTGTAEENTVIKIEYPEFSGYEVKDGQETEFTLTENTTITIEYEKEASPATPSEPDETLYDYTVECINFNTDDVIATYTGKGEADSEINPNYEIDGYTIMDEYSFELSEDNLTFEIYYTEDKEEASYTVYLVDDQTQDELKTITDTGIIGEEITIDEEIEGYQIASENTFTLTEDNQEFTIYYSEIADLMPYTFVQIDIDTDEEIGQEVIYGELNEVINLNPNDFSIDGYKLLGDIPDSVRISSIESNNTLKLFYKEINEFEPEKQDVSYTIEFVSEHDRDVHIFDDQTGIGKDGDEIPVYFMTEITLQDGTMWKAIGDSPRLFTLKFGTVNVFTVEFEYVGMADEEEDTLYPYEIRYVAEDTGATLGVNKGYANEGKIISFRNTFDGYSFKDDTNYLKVSSNEADNKIEVVFKRTSFPGPDKNPNTGEYDMNNWTVVFVDQNGVHLMENVSGKSLINGMLYIDYPNTIDLGDGNVYRAVVDSPYIKMQEGTTPKTIEIEYTKGDPSETKLDEWKQTAQEAKNEFYNTTPFDYKVIYRERNSWNDIGMYVGVNTKDSYISIPAVQIDEYEVPENELGGFDLTEDGMIEYTDYVRFASGSSNQGVEIPYTITFEDSEGNDLFPSYTGRVSGERENSIVNFTVYFPETFTDSEGNVWRAEESSPQVFKIDALSLHDNLNTIHYNMTYENKMDDFVIKNEAEGLDKLREFFMSTNDTEEHTIYLIGENYNPKDMIPGDLQSIYDIKAYGNAVMDSFEIDGTTYTVSKITFRRSFYPDNCTHVWEITSQTSGGCLVNGSETITCQKCGEEHEIILPALGHIDLDYDTVCDNCGERAFETMLGDELIVNWESGDLDIGNYQFTYVCIDDDYNGTGKMLYMATEDMNNAVYGEYSSNGYAEFNNSNLRDFLNEEFLDGLGELRNALENVDSNRITMLTKEQYDYYKENSENQYAFPDGVFLTTTVSADGTKVVLTDGTEVTPDEANNYGVRPIILLDAPDTSDTVNKTTWNIGDVQARTIGGVTYLFRCIDDNYKDKTNTSKRMALFLCETVIPADIIDNPTTENYETLFFGDDNNYKFSDVNQWLVDNSQDVLFSISSVNVGVDSSYSGSTGENKFSQLNERDLRKTNFSQTQTMYSDLFILSVEEALEYKNYLWKFEDSSMENPNTQIRPYCLGYWLRTPETGTDDMIYSVNLQNGTIEPVSVKATEGNDYSVMGIRPAFVMPQYE